MDCYNDFDWEHWDDPCVDCDGELECDFCFYYNDPCFDWSDCGLCLEPYMPPEECEEVCTPSDDCWECYEDFMADADWDNMEDPCPGMDGEDL